MPSNFRPLISPDRETDLNTGHDWPILITWPEYWLDWSRLVPNEEETAAERCSEKLVDLVVLLTTKLDNNVEGILASDWSTRVTWPEHWPLIGWQLNTCFLLVRIWERSWLTTSTRTSSALRESSSSRKRSMVSHSMWPEYLPLIGPDCGYKVSVAHQDLKEWQS